LLVLHAVVSLTAAVLVLLVLQCVTQHSFLLMQHRTLIQLCNHKQMMLCRMMAHLFPHANGHDGPWAAHGKVALYRADGIT
jgi:hypothetical protein